MQKTDAFQERFLLTLDSDPTSELIRSVLKSPLGLAHEIIRCLFQNNFDKIRAELDGIKEFVAGVTRAEKLGELTYGITVTSDKDHKDYVFKIENSHLKHILALSQAIHPGDRIQIRIGQQKAQYSYVYGYVSDDRIGWAWSTSVTKLD